METYFLFLVKINFTILLLKEIKKKIINKQIKNKNNKVKTGVNSYRKF